jgi:hypothetical protein
VTTATYNDIEFADVLVEDISQTPVYDQTGVDYLYTTVVVVFRGIVHVTSPAQIGTDVSDIGGGGSDLCLILNTPKRPFKLDIGGALWFDVIPGASALGLAPAGTALRRMDVNHGPKPTVTAYQIVGTRSVRITMSIEMAIPMCSDNANLPPNGVINFRFWTADSISCDTWLTNRVWRGRIRVRHAGYNPHVLRALAEAEDALSLDFMVVDEEMYSVPPPPATYWDGHYTINVGLGGNYYIETVFVQLAGPKTVSRVDLYNLAHRIIESKIDFIRRMRSEEAYLVSAMYRESLQSNRVEASATVRTAATSETTTMLNVAGSHIGTPITLSGYDPNTAALPNPTASMTGAFIAALQSSCSPVYTAPYQMNPQWPSGNNNLGQQQQGTTDVQQVQAQALPQFQPHRSESQQDRSYTHWSYQTDYWVDEGKISLPRTKKASDKSTSAVLQVHEPIVYRSINIYAWRLGKSPEIVKPVDFVDHNGIEHNILHWRLIPSAPQSSVDGVNTLHETSAYYLYRMSRKPEDEETYATGHVPYRAADPINLSTYDNSSLIAPGENSIQGDTKPLIVEGQ